jgi:hypothetical protein
MCLTARRSCDSGDSGGDGGAVASRRHRRTAERHRSRRTGVPAPRPARNRFAVLAALQDEAPEEEDSSALQVTPSPSPPLSPSPPPVTLASFLDLAGTGAPRSSSRRLEPSAPAPASSAPPAWGPEVFPPLPSRGSTGAQIFSSSGTDRPLHPHRSGVLVGDLVVPLPAAAPSPPPADAGSPGLGFACGPPAPLVGLGDLVPLGRAGPTQDGPGRARPASTLRCPDARHVAQGQSVTASMESPGDRVPLDGFTRRRRFLSGCGSLPEP